MGKTIMVAGAALAILASGASAQETMDFRFLTSDRNGVCGVGFHGATPPGANNPMEFHFTYRVGDGNMATEIKLPVWKRAQEKAESEETFPMTVSFDTGKTTTSRSGGYNSGYIDGAWAGWGAGPNSDALYAMLKDAKSVKVKFDGMDLGTVNLQRKGFAHGVLSDCIARNRSGAAAQ
jgi:hypothetical protein